MKSLLFVSILLSSIFANNVHWQSTFDEAHHLAVQNSKYLMVLLIEKDDSKNEKILINTFMNKTYVDTINADYISVMVTKNQESSYPIELLFTVSYPAVFFLDDKELFLCDPLLDNITPDRLKAHLIECK